MKENCLKILEMGVVTFLAREMLVRDWLDLSLDGGSCFNSASPPPGVGRQEEEEEEARPRSRSILAAADGLRPRPLLAGISMEMEPPNIESGRLSPQQQRWSGRQLRQAEEETSSSSSSSSSGGEATVRVCRWRRGHCVSRR